MCRTVVLGEADRSSNLRITFLPDTHAGVTLRNAGNGHGVVVSKLTRGDRAVVCGLRVGDRITHVNGIRVCQHRDAVAMFDQATRLRAELCLRVRRTRWLFKKVF